MGEEGFVYQARLEYIALCYSGCRSRFARETAAFLGSA
jgi:hypothetical protein